MLQCKITLKMSPALYQEEEEELHGPKVKVAAPPIKKTEVRNSRGFSFEVRKIPLRFKHH